MILQLTEKEKSLLKKAKIAYYAEKDYTEDEILEMADMLFDLELEMSESHKKDAALLASGYSDLVDKLQDLVSEEE